MRNRLLHVATLATLGLVAACAAIVGIACGSFSGSTDDGAVDATTSDEGGPESGLSTDGAAAGDSDATSDGAPGGPDGGAVPGVFCGAAGSCDPRTEVCCEHLAGGGVGCLPAAMRGTCQGLDLGCDDNADCAYMPGGVCCGTPASNRTDLLESFCAPSTMQCMTQPFWVVICNPSAPAGTACPDGRACHVPDGGAYGFCDGLLSQ